MENIDLVIEQTSINPQHNSLFPYHLQSDNNYYLNSLHSNMSNNFKQLNRKKCILFWCSDSAFAHIWFILIVNCKWIWTDHYSQKTLRTHRLCLWLKYSPLHYFCLHLSEINTFFNLQDSMIILLWLSYKLKSQDQT